ncbi:probable LRR receptor-like serine/threonine-protein kinase At3g47570 [Gossypium arboreum]|uniref:probable LRR receptor-like serine/threonine-protein kinase At3g47570 n=1 Tax=Gossypium arboreum TaxID=29729 RepID=UPI0022F1C832|nr:probable LRR receptor-like serine/threonine-protein kinase At3g47570 [Gossypium arboreum]
MENFPRSKEYWQVVSEGIIGPVVGTMTDAQKTEFEGLKLKDFKAKNYLFQAIDRTILETILCKILPKNIGFHEEEIRRTMLIVNKMRIHGEKMEDMIVVEKIFRSMAPKFNYMVEEEVHNINNLRLITVSHFEEEAEAEAKEEDVEATDQQLNIQNLKTNLLSISQLQEKGYEITVKNGICRILDDKCIVNKQHKDPFSKGETQRARELLEIVHSDLCGPINPTSNGGKRYGFNLLSLATASPVVRGNDTDQQALLQFKAKITGDPLKIMESWNSSIHFCQWIGVACGRKHRRVTKLKLRILKLSGSLSPYIGNLSFLRELDLVGNSFYNQIPQEIRGLRRLEALNLANNSISGEIPSNLSACSKLTLVDMSDNQLTGEIPALLGLLSNLKVLGFFNNSLRGNIPPSLGNLSSLERLGLTYNALSGIIPESFGRLRNLSFFTIFGNAISGIVPVPMFNLSNIRIFDIGANQIEGTLHSDLEINMPHVEFFSVGDNQISGQIPLSIFNAPNFDVLEFYDNMLDGNALSMSYNNILGKIPDEIGNLINLEVLDLAQNQLLDLSHNNLSGPIPPEILGLSSLSIVLSLSSNSLTGELPVEVEKLKNLGQLDVSHNRLSGLLPNNLGSCVSLVELYLEGNLFEGPIHPYLSSLRGLEALDASNNNLSGGIPEFLVRFGTLKYLNLSFNNFEGVIPSEGVFKNTSAIFVEGNNKLCGGIPELHLSRSEANGNSCRKFPLRLSYQSILRATNGFSPQNLVGLGGFGSVYKGILEANGAVIAVKVLNLLNHRASRSFLVECEALKNIRHRNLVKVLTAISGIDYQGNDFKALVYEFMENGSLEDWLHSSVGMNEPETMRNLNFIQRVNVAVDVAHALEYLHHRCETPIIHCDLKPSNVLLDGEMVGHISDFGLAKILSGDKLDYSTNESSSLGLRGTIGYAPFEYGTESELSTNGDVYSYGILLLEMLTGKRPTNERFKEGLSLHNCFLDALFQAYSAQAIHFQQSCPFPSFNQSFFRLLCVVFAKCFNH